MSSNFEYSRFQDFKKDFRHNFNVTFIFKEWESKKKYLEMYWVSMARFWKWEGALGVASLSSCRTYPIPAGFKMHPPLVKAENQE